MGIDCRKLDGMLALLNLGSSYILGGWSLLKLSFYAVSLSTYCHYSQFLLLQFLLLQLLVGH